MSVNHPITFSSLLLGGFLLVLIPLLGGIYNLSNQLDRMSLEGRRSVQITEETTLKNRQLAEAALSLQRAAGQFYVLEDPALLDRLENAHQRFIDAIAALQSIPMDGRQTKILSDLSTQESSLFDRLRSRRSTGADGFKSFKADFDLLHQKVSDVSDQLSRLIQQQQTLLRETAEQVQQTLIWQSTAVIAFSLLLAAVLSWLLSRPVRQLSESIQRLGDDDLVTPVFVSGPRDMALLGQQLDWLRRRLAELEDQKQRFFRQVSHELKTPLTALWEAVDLLSDKVAGNLSIQQEEIVEIMQGNVRVLRQRIEDLLQYQNALYQTKVRETSTLSLQSLIETTARNFDLSIKSKHLTLSSRDTGVVFPADRGEMEIVFNNLISNAIRFSPDGGTIEIGATRSAHEIQITISDQGPGIPLEDRAYIFQPFYQAGNQPPGKIQGSGLGLAIARAHIETHGGDLSLCDDESAGTRFLIRLPLDRENLSHAR